MKKIIVIKQNNKGNIDFAVKGFSAFETLGILRFYEKRIWLNMNKGAIREGPGEGGKG